MCVPGLDLELPKEMWQLLRIDSRVVRLTRRFEDVAWPDLGRRIPLREAVSNPVPKYLASGFKGPLGNVPSASLVDQANHRDHLGSFDF